MELVKAQSIGIGGPPDAPPLSEAALIRAAQNHDSDAFEQLVRLYDRSVLRVTMNLLRSPEDARDAYQEAFLKVYRRLDASASIAAFTLGSTASRRMSASTPAAQERAQGAWGG